MVCLFPRVKDMGYGLGSPVGTSQLKGTTRDTIHISKSGKNMYPGQRPMDILYPCCLFLDHQGGHGNICPPTGLLIYYMGICVSPGFPLFILSQLSFPTAIISNMFKLTNTLRYLEWYRIS